MIKPENSISAKSLVPENTSQATQNPHLPTRLTEENRNSTSTQILCSQTDERSPWVFQEISVDFDHNFRRSSHVNSRAVKPVTIQQEILKEKIERRRTDTQIPQLEATDTSRQRNSRSLPLAEVLNRRSLSQQVDSEAHPAHATQLKTRKIILLFLAAITIFFWLFYRVFISSHF